RPAAVRSGEEAYRHAKVIDDRVRMARALLRLCGPRFQLGDTEVAQQGLDEAFAILAPLGDTPELAHACFNRSYRAAGEGDMDGVVDWGRRAVRIARAVGDRQIEVLALSFVGVGLMSRGDPEGSATARGAAALAVEYGLVLAAIRTYLNLPELLRAWNAPSEERMSALACARELAERHGWRGDRLVAAEAGEAFEDGRWDEALRLASEISGTAYLASTGMRVAFAEAARHGPAAGVPLLDDPRRRLLAAGTSLHTIQAARASETMLLVGDARAALELAEPAAALIGGLLTPSTQDAIAISAIVAAGLAGDAARRELWLGLGLGVQRQPERPGVRARRAFALAERAADAGDLDSAIAAHAEHADLFARSFDRFPWTQTQLRHAELLVRRGAAGDAERAASVFAAVVPYWRTAGAAWYLARLRTWATARGIPFPRGARAHAASASSTLGLTPREREVAALIAAGMTNRQIAERLVIAERTAEGHVERIREKLSFNSRTEIAAWFARTVAGQGGLA
ncbi:MAG TPA: helix-turn-helix transcriptional regulator, partial [Candidatus Limnocylindria bacterium]|nr:helix-turn-helix transcriptional regulator [Candidatus Limnocylindria bacterium]